MFDDFGLRDHEVDLSLVDKGAERYILLPGYICCRREVPERCQVNPFPLSAGGD